MTGDRWGPTGGLRWLKGVVDLFLVSERIMGNKAYSRCSPDFPWLSLMFTPSTLKDWLQVWSWFFGSLLSERCSIFFLSAYFFKSFSITLHRSILTWIKSFTPELLPSRSQGCAASSSTFQSLYSILTLQRDTLQQIWKYCYSKFL